MYNNQRYQYCANQSQNYANTYNSNTVDHAPELGSTSMSNSNTTKIELKDYGAAPFVVNINEATKQNNNFRTALWTGKHLQLTLMSIPVNGEIGLENHPNLDQFIRIEQGQGLVQMGDRKDCLNFQKKVYEDYAFIIPAGKWHNLINTGNIPIKLYSIYAPPQHPYGTVHVTKQDAEAEEHMHSCNYQDKENTSVSNQENTSVSNRENTSVNNPENNLFGAQAAKADKKLTLKNMLNYAIEDEYLARARYLYAIEKFGQQRPFVNILNAEENHIRYLQSLFSKYNIVLPKDNSENYVKEAASIKESLEQGVQGEIENIAMYERFLNQNIPNDVKSAFFLLRNASQNHLQTFRRTLSFY